MMLLIKLLEVLVGLAHLKTYLQQVPLGQLARAALNVLPLLPLSCYPLDPTATRV